MRIGMNMLFLQPGIAGTRTYCTGLLRGLAEIDKENEYFLYTRTGTPLPDLPADRFRQIECPVSKTGQLWRVLWEYGRLPNRVARDEISLFHALGNVSPRSKTCPFVLTIHDVIYHHYPQVHRSLLQRCFLKCVTPRMARRADRVIVYSKHSAEEVVRWLGVQEKKIRLVLMGGGAGFEAIDDTEQIQETLQRYDISSRYVLSVARAAPHKNLDGLLRAFANLKRMSSTPVQLVLVGDPGDLRTQLESQVSDLGLTSEVRLTGYVPKADLLALYTSASVFAFPSLAEGFGLPITEAMACGIPVVASNVSAVPEAVGGAGVLVDTQNPQQFAEALRTVLENETLQTELREKGYGRVKEMSWQNCARGTLDVYREVMGR